MSGGGRIVVISGPSGVGKTTVVRRLLATGRYVLSVSATTRPPRGREQHGVDYLFVSVPEFEAMRDRGELLEWARVHETRFYGTPEGPVREHLAAGRDVILDIDVQGAAQLRRRGDLPLVSVFLLPPSLELLRRRLEGRNDTAPEEVERRLRIAREEIAASAAYDLRVTNDDVERSVTEIEAFLAGIGPDAPATTA